MPDTQPMSSLICCILVAKLLGVVMQPILPSSGYRGIHGGKHSPTSTPDMLMAAGL
jgi:hypothetical protein